MFGVHIWAHKVCFTHAFMNTVLLQGGREGSKHMATKAATLLESGDHAQPCFDFMDSTQHLCKDINKFQRQKKAEPTSMYSIFLRRYSKACCYCDHLVLERDL